MDRIKKACRLAQQVKIYCFNSKAGVWWQQERSKLERLEACCIQFPYEQIQAASQLVSRSMKWYITLSDNQASIHCDQGACELQWQVLLGAATQ